MTTPPRPLLVPGRLPARLLAVACGAWQLSSELTDRLREDPEWARLSSRTVSTALISLYGRGLLDRQEGYQPRYALTPAGEAMLDRLWEADHPQATADATAYLLHTLALHGHAAASIEEATRRGLLTPADYGRVLGLWTSWEGSPRAA